MKAPDQNIYLYYNMENWVIYIWVAIIFFVIGQSFLKFDKNNALITCCFFTISMGILGLSTLLYLMVSKSENVSLSRYGLLAGILFFFGNLLWILSIKVAPSLSHIRVTMAGGETILLLISGYLLFKERILTINNIIGILLVLSGVYMIA